MKYDIDRICVKEFRCSLIWVSLLTNGGMLKKRADYCSVLNEAASNVGEWSLPWTEKPRVDFWHHYLQKKELVTKLPANENGVNTCVISFNKAIGCLVPLRAKNLGKIDLINTDLMPQQEFKAWIEGFAYPHGVACIITFRWRSKDGLNLPDMVDRLIELRNWPYKWTNNSLMFGDGQSLNDIGRQTLNCLSFKSNGKIQDNFKASPYSIVTIVEAENAPLVGPPEETDEIFHKSLDALCTLNQNWRSAKTLDLKDALLRTKWEDENSVLYARGLGRSIWLPSYFRQNQLTSKCKSFCYLGRYHRNITLATMQTAYLSFFLKWVNAQHLAQHLVLAGAEQGWARAAAGAVARLYGKCPRCYMSSSLPEQILPFKSAINSVRKYLMPDGRRLSKPNFKKLKTEN